MRCCRILSGNKVVGNLFVSIHIDSEQNTTFKPLPKQSQRTALFQSLHKCVEMSLASLSECVYNDLQCRTKCCTDVLNHFSICPYVANISETEDLLEIMQVGQIRFSCHVCLSERERLLVITLYRKGKLYRTIATTNTCTTANLTRNEIEDKFAEGSRPLIVPVLSEFSFMDIHSCADVYLILRSKPMYCLFRGVGGNIKKMYSSRAWS